MSQHMQLSHRVTNWMVSVVNLDIQYKLCSIFMVIIHLNS